MPTLTPMPGADRDAPHPIDTHVGARLRLRRRQLRLSQTNLADAVSVTFQQVQKYENGTNRVSASRLHEFSRLLDVPIGWFFEGLDGASKGAAGASAQGGLPVPPANQITRFFGTVEGARLAGVYARLSLRAQRQILALAESLAEAEDDRRSAVGAKDAAAG